MRLPVVRVAKKLLSRSWPDILARPVPGSLTLEKGARYIGILQRTGHHDLARQAVPDVSGDLQQER